MKKSRKVSLLVLGTATVIAGCDDVGQQTSSGEVRQGFYTTREDCEHDWGKDSRDCTPAATTQPASNTASNNGGGTGMHSGGGYFGPRYYWDRSAGYPVAVEPNGELRALPNSYLSRSAPSVARSTSSVGHVSVARGGFGGMGHGISAGG